MHKFCTPTPNESSEAELSGEDKILIIKSRKPFYEGLLPIEELPKATQSFIQRLRNIVARLTERLLNIIKGSQNLAKSANSDHENAQVMRCMCASDNTSEVKKSGLRENNVTLH